MTKLARIHHYKPVLVGRHGGGDLDSKLEASIERQAKLFKKIRAFSPDLTLSSCSPDAARISFGLGIRHVAFHDAPHHNAALRLTVPLIQKLLIPGIIPKGAFSRFGIDKKNIIQYKAIDAAVTIKRKVDPKSPLPFPKNSKKNIVVRVEEEEAAYTSKSNKTAPIIQRLVRDFPDENIAVLARYARQTSNLQRKFGKKAKIFSMSFDGKHLLDHTDVFVGSGGTMTYESALMGVPTISYNAVPNITEKYLVNKSLVYRETSPARISSRIKKIFGTPNHAIQKRAKKILGEMEDPLQTLAKVIKE